MRISSVGFRVFVLTAAVHLLPVAPPALAQTDIHSEQQKLTALDADGGEAFGKSVSISGNRIVVGAPSDDDEGNSTGSAYIFRLSIIDDIWIQETKLTASDAAAGDQFGHSVAVRRDRAVVGARLDDDAEGNSGSAYIFRRDDNGTPSDPGDDVWIEETKLTDRACPKCDADAGHLRTVVSRE